MNSRLSRPLLTIAVSGALVAGSGLVASPALAEPADTVAPVGSFKLNSAAFWIGQSVSLTQGTVTDETSAPDQITRVADWGDGTPTTTLAPGTVKYAHKYAKTGKFTVKVTYTDAAGNASDVTSAVTVTTPGRVKLSKTSVWNGERLSVTFSGVPAGTKKIVFDWGDSFVDTLPGKNQSIRGLYYKNKKGRLIRGAVTMRATYTNSLGASSAIVVGKVTVKKDTAKPVVKITKPGSANRLKSWKTIKGTVADKGAIAPYVYVWATRITGNKSYCFTAKKTWKRYYGTAGYNKYCSRSSVEVTITKGKWSMKLPGLKKGTLYVDARSWDWADNASKWASVKAKITRS
ncbi:hypothetical protein DMB66_56090 [Actinoplanes sp. ATCC 53533]|uniref:PKD domain-containing protein n=1 Tax=Actinoplanes sp. ATCC 53533 TaxID=1288362 RepID=UPI000F77BC1E|nr:hypothetical protein [Actinoplanes sp. ATCC 53533]RSM41380.1 hypothetical protein DMB66_56090 [Actinoplanes sp. ATCC 53533]